MLWLHRNSGDPVFKINNSWDGSGNSSYSQKRKWALSEQESIVIMESLDPWRQKTVQSNALTIHARIMSLVSLQRSMPRVSCYHFPASHVTHLPESETYLKMWDLTKKRMEVFANNEHRTLDGLATHNSEIRYFDLLVIHRELYKKHFSGTVFSPLPRHAESCWICVLVLFGSLLGYNSRTFAPDGRDSKTPDLYIHHPIKYHEASIWGHKSHYDTST